MKKMISFFAFVIILLAVPGAAKADTMVFTTTLTAAEEVPQNSSPGTGIAVITINGNMMTVNVTFSSLVGNTTVAHIHCCTPPGANAMVATAVPRFPGFPVGVTSGSYLQTFDLTLASTYNPAFVTAQGGLAQAQSTFLTGLQNGLTYFNIHSNLFPGGEIRGQLQPVPEPTTMLLLGTGLTGLALARRRRKK